MKYKIFISSVQREFAKERKALAMFIRKDIVLSKFFEVFLFEETPAANASPKMIYLKEVARSDIYLGVIGEKYGYEDEDGVSATEREYDCAVTHGVHRLVFVKQLARRESKEAAFLAKVESECVRKSFPSLPMLRDAVAASLVRFLEEHGKIQTEPFDTAVCADATMKDLSVARMKDFIRTAREKRGFKLPISTSGKDLLTHLNLLRG